MFGAIVLIATILSVLSIVRNIALRKLPPNRFRRGIRLGLTGIGIGLSFTLALAVFRVVAPEGLVWVPLVLTPALIGFVLGLVSPGILSIDKDEIDRARQTLARASGGVDLGDDGQPPVTAEAAMRTGPDIDLREPDPAHETVAAGVGSRSKVGAVHETVAAGPDSRHEAGLAHETVAGGSGSGSEVSPARGTVAPSSENGGPAADRSARRPD